MRRALCVGGAVVALSGCGASAHTATVGTSTGQAPTPAASPAVFIAKADAVCAALKQREASLTQRFTSLAGSSAAEEREGAPIMRGIVRLARAADARFAAIPVPPQDASAVARLLTGYSEEATDLNKAAAGFESHEQVTWEAALGALTKAELSGHRAALGLGLKKCGG